MTSISGTLLIVCRDGLFDLFYLRLNLLDLPPLVVELVGRFELLRWPELVVLEYVVGVPLLQRCAQQVGAAGQ